MPFTCLDVSPRPHPTFPHTAPHPRPPFKKCKWPYPKCQRWAGMMEGGPTSLQRPCLYQTAIRLILIREYLPLQPPRPHQHHRHRHRHPPPQATRQRELWQLKKKGGGLSSSISRWRRSVGRLDDKVHRTLCVADSCGRGGAAVIQVGGLTPRPRRPVCRCDLRVRQ